MVHGGYLTHLGHYNIIRHCNRPFEKLHQMDQTLIDNINALVQPQDTLYHLGDFSFKGKNIIRYREQINCQNIFLIMGNHDPQSKTGKPQPILFELFKEVRDFMYIETKVNNKPQFIFMSHYAMRSWRASHYGSYCLYGHSHGNLEDLPDYLSFDVGVDSHDFKPVNLEQVASIMQSKLGSVHISKIQ